MENSILLCLLLLASTDCGKALLDLTGTQEVKGTWKASATLPCVYEPSADFKQEAVMWKASLADHTLRTIFRRDLNSGDQTLLTHFRNKIRVPKDLPGNVSLFLEDLEMADGGQYTCEVVWEARNKSRVTKDWTTVLTVVKVAVTKPIITAGTAGSLNLRGGKITLTCQADGSPPITYRWFKAVSGGNAQQVSRNANLHFNSLQVSDGGTYYCEAGNRVSSAVQRSDTFQLTVEGPAELPPLRPSVPTAETTAAAGENGPAELPTLRPSVLTAETTAAAGESGPAELPPLRPSVPTAETTVAVAESARRSGLPLYVIVLIAVLCVAVLGAVFAVVFCRRNLKADHVYEVSYNRPMIAMREEPSPAGGGASGQVTPRAENNYTVEPTKTVDYVPMGPKTDSEYESLVLKMESEYEVADAQEGTCGTTWRPTL